MSNKKLDFAAIYRWIDYNSAKVNYRSQIDLFELLFNFFTVKEQTHYSAGRISQILRGSVALPAEIVTRYQINDAYIASLMDAVETLITIDFPDAPAALADLAQMIAEDDTISEIQKRNLLCNADVGGGDASIEWVTDIIRFAMLPRRDTRQKIA